VRLTAGARLGPYEILAPLGAGGMGEVYRATDTRLGRDVAIKILTPDTSASPEARQRFEREARTISQLSHPHICALFDVGESASPEHPAPSPYLVMELLDGETLAQRLASGALPLDLTLRYATQIADALDKAHRAGIVHRDLKPANVMLTRAGVKLLDFGLAKPSALSPSIAETAAPLTGRGVISGTVQYMAPEQLAGRPADARSDIYALGAVIYEMAAGRPAFGATLTPILPAALDRLVRTCLAPDPDERWQSTHDVALQLAAIAADPPRDDGGDTRLRARVLPWLVTAAALVAAAGLWWRSGVAAPPAQKIVRFEIPPPEGGEFADTVESLSIALAPDGSQLAYLATDATGDRRVWLRPLSAATARPLAGTEGARALFWSPSGRSIAFFAGDKLKRLDLPDGAPVTLSDVPDVRAVGSWGADYIIYATIPAGLFRVPVAGGSPVMEAAPDRSKLEVGYTFPHFLPDGRRYLYTVRRRDGTANVRLAEPGAPTRDLLAVSSNAEYVDPGFLVYSRDGTLVASRFDAAAVRLIGEPMVLAEPVRYFGSTGVATFTASRTGVLVYQSHTEQGRLVWLDRAGNEVGVVGEPSGHSRVRIAPDGRRVMFDRGQPRLGTYDLWLLDVVRGVEQRITSDRTSEFGPVWLPGDRFVVYSAGIPPHLVRRDLQTGTDAPLLSPREFQLAEDMSPDGKTLLFTQRTPRGNFDVWSTPIDGDRIPATSAPVLETPSDEGSVRFSPDGRFIALASDELGRYEVFVAAFPLTGVKTRVSNGGGNLPRWSRDGRELFFLSADLHLMAVPVRTSPSLVLGTPRALFPIRGGTLWGDPKPNAGWPDFDVSLDGTRFLAIMPQPANRKPATAVLNWTAGLDR
jgi:Tol biopolymer transport system component